MKLSGWIVVFGVMIGVQAAHASDATTPIDFTRRNTPFAAQPGIAPAKNSPSASRTLQDARVEKDVRQKEMSAVGDRRAAVDVTETSAKKIVAKDSQQPVRSEQPVSDFNQRPAAISTAKDSRKPPMVARYQDGLAAASATNMARFPAMDAGTKVTINRFVFRKNAPDTTPDSPQGIATPAGGGSPVRR